MVKIPTTDVRRLSAEICEKPYRYALPASLPDHWFHPLVRDLREIERMKRGDTKVEPQMAGPLLVAMHVTRGRMKERSMKPDFFFTESQMVSWFQMYQYYIEREMISRIVGMRMPGEAEALCDALDHEIDHLRAVPT
jgi:hypothetical protein